MIRIVQRSHLICHSVDHVLDLADHLLVCVVEDEVEVVLGSVLHVVGLQGCEDLVELQHLRHRGQRLAHLLYVVDGHTQLVARNQETLGLLLQLCICTN